MSTTAPVVERIAALRAELQRLAEEAGPKGRAFAASSEEEVRRLADALATDISKYVGEAERQASRTISTRPLAAVGLSFLAGVVIGALWGRR